MIAPLGQHLLIPITYPHATLPTILLYKILHVSLEVEDQDALIEQSAILTQLSYYDNCIHYLFSRRHLWTQNTVLFCY